MPFETYAMLINAKKVTPSTRSNYVAVDRDYWVHSFACRVQEVALDAEWYVSRYPDVAQAIARGDLDSAMDHYCRFGYYEHRLPYAVTVEGDWYLTQYSDVRVAIAQQLFGSAQEHFEEVGFREGRHPHPSFALRKVGEAAAEHALA